jgi:DNA-directed RNA polymerase specialized sigma24 family protein
MGGTGSQFPSTRWSLILDARTQDETRRQRAAQNLIEGYWKPVYCYLRKRRYRNEDAKDLTQDFFCEFFVTGRLLHPADKKIGRFRSFLLTALEHFISNVERDKKRKKRAPPKGIISLSSPQFEDIDLPAAAVTPEEAFDHAWTAVLLYQVIREVKKQYSSPEMLNHWRVFELKILAPALDNAQDLSMRQISQRCGVDSEGRAANMLITVKRRFRSVLRRRLRDLALSDSEAEAELREISAFNKLARLCEIGDDTPGGQDRPNRKQEEMELLRDRLADPLPLDPGVARTLPAALRHVLEHFAPFPDCSVGALLLDPDIDSSVLWQIKDRYREKAESSPSELERQVATVVYYAAIANALVFHEESLFGENKITTFSYSELEGHLSQLLEIDWLTTDLASLFERAYVICRGRRDLSSQ